MGVRELGYITYVETSTRGSETSAVATLGDPAIVVADVSGFLPDGGLLDIGQALVPLGYTSAVRNADGLTGTLTLTDALAADVAEGTRVDLWARRGPSTYYTATVDTGAGEISATLPAHLIPHLEGGPRTDDAREYVECERQDSKWVVVDVLLQDPAVDLGYADGTKPVTPGAVVQSYAQFPEEHAGGVPPLALGDGKSNSDIEFAGRVQVGPLTATPLGTRVTDAAGATRFFVDPDGATHHGGDFGDFDQLQARSGSLAGPFLGKAGGSLTLEDVGLLLPPAQPPVTAYDWITTIPDLGEGNPRNRKSLGLKSGTEAFTTITNQRTRIIQFDPTGVTATTTRDLTGAPTDAQFVSADYSSLTDCIQELVFDSATATWLVRYFDWTTLAFDHEWTVTQLGSVLSPLPAIASFSAAGHEYTRIVRSNPDGTVAIHRYDNEAFVATTTTTDAFNFGDLETCGALGSCLLLTGARNIIADASTVGGFYVGQPVLPLITLGLGVPPLAVGDTLGYLLVENGDLAAAGIASIDTDTNFRTWYLSGGSDTLAQQSNALEAGGYYTAVTYYDSATAHESVMSLAPILQEKVPGARVTYTVPPPPPGTAADSMRVYLARDLGAGVPARTAFWRQATSAPGEYHAAVFTVLTSGANPPATGTIPSGDPFEIRSGAGTLLMDGTGYVAGGTGSGDRFLLNIEVDEMTGDITFEEVMG